ncbi:PaaX family transcriptional regulator C-terminal domain-containing protein [Spongiactinospora sp. TRM90649]|uniref:PaaX family transcriptional regulator n=1 Tax=Spongiactinospora sp. TRM90649 TaxID=3031114 RepID=UPI0023F7D488|nr:PaaX family transcriptional regulator C-terminal domain-containing protein [Spongiactinospora sp. TRM90649]MDF5755452.1 PaaX family transcriptional regulator C-terminal domain-containing protein [Spongiactinospora sp. TRM90649]
MNARAALFDLYGDHLRSRGGRASVAALVRLLAPLEIAAPAVRTAISRMVRQGWLAPLRLPPGPGYAVTPKCVRRLDEAALRIYRAGAIPWSGKWHVVVVEQVRERPKRERLRADLAFLGYAPLSETTWIGPRPSPELSTLLGAEQVRADRFDAALDGDPRDLVARAWDLASIAGAYDRWLSQAAALVGGLADDDPDDQIFAARSLLVHGWRNFLFRDPGLPPELLPPGWPGEKARTYFEQEAARLLPAAAAFVDRNLADQQENP